MCCISMPKAHGTEHVYVLNKMLATVSIIYSMLFILLVLFIACIWGCECGKGVLDAFQ